MVPVLDCQRCGELTPASRFRYVCDRLVCDHCGAENSQMRVHSVQTRDIFIHFVTVGACSVRKDQSKSGAVRRRKRPWHNHDRNG